MEQSLQPLRPLKGNLKRNPFHRSAEQIAALLDQQHENAVAKGLVFDPLEMELRAESEVMLYIDEWGEEWTVRGGATMPVISRHLVTISARKHGVVPETPQRDPDELSQEITNAEKQYREWLAGGHSELTRIQDPEALRTSAKAGLQAVAAGNIQAQTNIINVDPSGMKPDPGPMNWGDRPGYVPSAEQKNKRDTSERNIKGALAERCYSMETIARVAGCSRDYVREISKHFCTPEEHKANLKREDF
jgi:AraC-like DNA-binding protein